MHEQQHANSSGNSRPWYRTRWGLALLGFAAIAALLLVYEHRVHIPFGNLSAALPLVAIFGLHLLMHGGHGGHSGHGGQRGRGGHGGHGRGNQPAPPPGAAVDTTQDASKDKRP